MFLPPLAGSALLTKDEWGRVAGTLRLSGRELEIVRDVFDNHTEHAIAADHFITAGTVHTHLKRLYHKLRVTTRVALVLRVMETLLHERGRSVHLENRCYHPKRGKGDGMVCEGPYRLLGKVAYCLVAGIAYNGIGCATICGHED